MKFKFKDNEFGRSVYAFMLKQANYNAHKQANVEPLPFSEGK